MATSTGAACGKSPELTSTCGLTTLSVPFRFPRTFQNTFLLLRPLRPVRDKKGGAIRAPAPYAVANNKDTTTRLTARNYISPPAVTAIFCAMGKPLRD